MEDSDGTKVAARDLSSEKVPLPKTAQKGEGGPDDVSTWGPSRTLVGGFGPRRAGAYAFFGTFGITCTTAGGCHPVSLLSETYEPGSPPVMTALGLGLTLAGAIIPWGSATTAGD
ncbi:MAG: hypothetical protein K6U14_11980 [Firmicutes bacterium]|nr:hypothetical protein [Alicyclobacillaceae bacterium]MCL6498331.1 hypothetical protein [Bacillota bacterium]